MILDEIAKSAKRRVEAEKKRISCREMKDLAGKKAETEQEGGCLSCDKKTPS